MKNKNSEKKRNRPRRLGLAALAVTALLTLTFSACSEGGSTELENSGFESGSGASIDGWSQYNYKKDYEGNTDCTQITLAKMDFSGQCVRIASQDQNDARIYQKIQVQPESNYCVKFDTLYENIDADVPEAERGAGLNVSVKDGLERSGSLYGSVSEWQTVTVYFKTVSDQESVELTIGIGGYGAESSGTAYIDNVRIEKVDSVPEGEVAFSAAVSSSDSQAAPGASIWLKLLFLLLAGGVIAFVIVVSLKADKENAAKNNPLSQKNPLLNKKDFIILIVLVVVCSAMSFYKLGNAYAASSYWKASEAGEYVIVEFDQPETVARTVYSNNIPTNNNAVSYTVYYETEDGSGEYKSIFSIKAGAFFEWEHVDSSFTTRRVKIVSTRSGLGINEMGFFRKNDSGEYEKLNVTVAETSYNKELNESHNPAMLFDEQDTVEPYSSYMSSTYFDEIYFPRTAYEHIHGYPVYEITHPPMGKILMSIGIRIFGMNPFGWRFMGTLFGVALVPLMYLLGLKLFKKRIYAFAAAFLMMFDFMRLAQTRLATIDSYSAFFILCMYYFMYDYFTQKSYEKKPFWKSLLPLLFCGIMFGLGASTKWVCLYAGVGLAFLFFLAKYLEADDIASGRALPANKEKSWFTHNFIPTCCACVVFFIVIPAAIYILSYIPYMAPSPDKSLIDIVLDNQTYMFNYHSGLTEGHPYGSAWYTWPINMRPIYYYSGSNANLAEGMSTSIVSMGNPLIWWTGLACIFPAAFYAWKKRDKGILVAFVGYAAQFFPWILVTRVVFIYHYFTAVPFMIFMIVYVIKNLIEDGVISRRVLWIYLALVLVLFIMFYPVLTGREVSRSYIDNFLRWFSTWSF